MEGPISPRRPQPHRTNSALPIVIRWCRISHQPLKVLGYQVKWIEYHSSLVTPYFYQGNTGGVPSRRIFPGFLFCCTEDQDDLHVSGVRPRTIQLNASHTPRPPQVDTDKRVGDGPHFSLILTSRTLLPSLRITVARKMQQSLRPSA